MYLFKKLMYGLILLNITRLHATDYVELVNITIVEDAIAKGAVCLDGSPAGYHYSKGFGDGTNHWLLYLPGGGWCVSTADCLDRVKREPNLATTVNFTNTYFDGILSPKPAINPDFYNWNRVSIRYCDGSSFMGDVEVVDPETRLHYRGARIFKAVVDELLAKGLRNARNVILAGNSAGGLATILNCDRFSALVPNANIVKCISDSGFFIRPIHLPYASKMEQSFSQVVALHGVAKSLPTSCTSRMDPSLCIFPENLVGDVQTPLFLLNSAFDKFQVSINLKPYPDESDWGSCTKDTETCTIGQLQIIKEFGNAFLDKLKNIGGTPSRGMFINSCYIHDHLYSVPRWNYVGSPRLKNKTIARAIGDWYFNRSIVVLIDEQIDYPVNCRVPL